MARDSGASYLRLTCLCLEQARGVLLKELQGACTVGVACKICQVLTQDGYPPGCCVRGVARLLCIVEMDGTVVESSGLSR